MEMDGMRHAVIVLCHKDLLQVRRLVRFFDSDFVFYIHIDRNAGISDGEIEETFGNMGNVHVFRRFRVTWGGINILRAELYLLRMISEREDVGYIHLLSGQDYPIKRLERIKEFFERNRGKQFIEFHQLPYDGWQNGTMWRLDRYHLYDRFDYFTDRGRKIILKAYDWQKRLGIRRGIPDTFPRLYGGSNWISVTKECADYIVKGNRKIRKFYNRLKYTFASDEVFFPTVIMNSPFRDSTVNDNRRLILWEEGSRSPETLTGRHWWRIATSDALWARKFSLPESGELFGLLDRYIFADPEVRVGANGAWQQESLNAHVYDKGVAEGLVWLIRTTGIRTAIDFGCGPGWYVKVFHEHGVDMQGYDGNPNVETVSARFFDNGFYCQQVDLDIDLQAEEPVDLVMSLEVGEHIPADREQVFIDNLVRNSSRYILLSWGIPGQGGDGHVNCRPNGYIITNMARRGFHINTPVSNFLRSGAVSPWFRNTLMFFEKDPGFSEAN